MNRTFRPGQAVLVGTAPHKREAHVMRPVSRSLVEVRFLDGHRDLVDAGSLLAVEGPSTWPDDNPLGHEQLRRQEANRVRLLAFLLANGRSTVKGGHIALAQGLAREGVVRIIDLRPGTAVEIIEGMEIEAQGRVDAHGAVQAPVPAIRFNPPARKPSAQRAMFDLWQGTETESKGRIPRILSYGGGVDSFCMLLGAVEADEKPDHIVFMDVGDPGDKKGKRLQPAEWPETYDHILEVAAPYAKKHGIPFHWIISGMPRGKLLDKMKRAGVIIQIYEIRPPKTNRAKLKRGAKGLFEYFLMMEQVPVKKSRLCTEVAKIERFDRWLADNFQGQDVQVWIGFENEEEYRQERGKSYQVKPLGMGAVTRHMSFPLIEKDLSRRDCINLIKRKKKRVPRKSSCVFCPFMKPEEWVDFFQRYPAAFKLVEALWENKPKTGPGYKLGQVFGKFSLSPAQYALMTKLSRKPRHRGDLVGSEPASWDSMLSKKWITKSGKLTKHGKAILKSARQGPPWSESHGGVSASSHNAKIVERAAKGKPKVGIHYDRATLEEWIRGELLKIRACKGTKEEKGLSEERVQIRRKVRRHADANPRPGGYEFWRACTDFHGPGGGRLIQYLNDHEKTVTYKTFASRAELGPLREVGHPAMWRLSAPDNWAVSFHRSRLPSGIPVYYFDWSRIEHIFTPSGVDVDVAAEIALLP